MQYKMVKARGERNTGRRVCEQRVTEKTHVQWKQRCNKDEERAIVIIGEHRGCVERLITANTDAMN